MRYIILILLLWTSLNAQNREALLIGNSNYQHISKLNDTSHNLSRLKTTLEKLGFTVKVKTNLEAKKLKQAIDNFKDRLARKHDTIGFLYYSGHGCQMDNVGYLIPTNVNSSKRLDVQYDALNIDKMLQTLKEAGNRVNMLFLDACRDNTPTGTKGGKKGLAQAPLTPKGTLVVYATEATKTADDNNNFINSLIEQIGKPNKSIRDIGYNISDDVATQTRENQVPQVFAQRVPDVVLKRGYVAPNSPQPVPVPVVVKTQTHTSKGITTIGNEIWQDEIVNETKTMNWKTAIKYCENLSLGAYHDWKFPSNDRLEKLYQNKNQLKYFAPSVYWSSTSFVGDEGNAWILSFYNGNVDRSYKYANHYVRCVRDG